MKNTNQVTNGIRQIALAVLWVSVFLATGCPSGNDKASPRKIVKVSQKQVIVGLDASGSARPFLGSYAALTMSVMESLTTDVDTLSLYRVDRETHLFSTGAVSGDSQALLQTITKEVKPLSTTTRTFPANFWKEVAEQVGESKSDTYVYFFTDGDNDDLRPIARREMQSAAQSMSRSKHLKAVVLCGVQRGNWENIRKDLAPLGSRLHPIFASEMDASKATNFLNK
jgi:hypothetical protein